jgi:general secretion pathway protein C
MDSTLIYRRLFTLADLALLVVAAWVASKLIIAIVVPPPGIDTARIEKPTGVQAELMAGNEADTDIILERNLFGSRVSATAGQAVKENIEELPDSTLPLELLGTVVQVEGKRSFAIILDKSTRKQGIYFIEDQISEGVSVSSVARNKVVLIRSGREEILEKTMESSQPPANVRKRTRPTKVQRSAAGSSESVTVRKVGEGSFVMDRREVEGVLQDFNKLLTQIRVVPHFSDGNPDGFKIFNIRPGSLFAQLGMVNGDIIKRVNGLEITGPEQALQMFQQLRDESQVTVDLERFRKNLTLQYEIR